MTRNKLSLVSAVGLISALALSPAAASAQCIGGIFCAQVNIGVGFSGGVVIGAPAPPPPAVVYVQQPAPPPVVVYEQPAPPPPVVVMQQPAPQVAYVQAQPLVPYQRRLMGWGIHGHVGGLFSDKLHMGGATAALRIRPAAQYAIDLGIGTYAGRDYNDRERVEVPLTVDGLLFMNGNGIWQPYLLAGVGVSFASVSGEGGILEAGTNETYSYFGGEVGAGVEWRLSPSFALSADVRAFIRERTSSSGSGPEFVEQDAFGRTTGRTSNTSVGALGTLGATLYF